MVNPKRIDDLENELKAVLEKVSSLDSKIDADATKMKNVHSRFEVVERHLMQIKKFLLGDNEKTAGPSAGTTDGKPDVTGTRSWLSNINIPPPPMFSGDDPRGWIFRIERYFLLYGLSDREKVLLAGVCMEGAALHWLQFRENMRPFTGWTELREELLTRFGSIIPPEQELMQLNQDGTVAEYRAEFERLAAAAREIPNDWLMNMFMAGLHKEIQADVKIFGPKDLDDLVRLALNIEARNQALKDEEED